LGDVLVVAVNSDASVRRLKGDSRPIVGDRDRASLLAALACVDYVTIFDDDTPERLIDELRPDVLVKGAETRPDGIPGSSLVASYGGRVELVPFLPDRSTTSLLARLRNESGHREQHPEGTRGNSSVRNDGEKERRSDREEEIVEAASPSVPLSLCRSVPESLPLLPDPQAGAPGRGAGGPPCDTHLIHASGLCPGHCALTAQGARSNE
jgi:rfaE bifunctional protein nucleotidyltransferase chain/domain